MTLPTISSTNTTITIVPGTVSGGTSPYSYELHRSTDPTFTPSGATLIASGSSAPTTDAPPPTKNTTYFYAYKITDSTSPTPQIGYSSKIAVALKTRPSIKIAVVGDSISSAGGNPADPINSPGATAAAFKADLEAILGCDITLANYAVSGTQTSDWISGGAEYIAYQSAIVAFAPDIVLLMLGANDAAVGLRTAAAYQVNMQAIVNWCRAATSNLGTGKVVVNGCLYYNQSFANSAFVDSTNALLLAYNASHYNLSGAIIGDRTAYQLFANNYNAWMQTDCIRTQLVNPCWRRLGLIRFYLSFLVMRTGRERGNYQAAVLVLDFNKGISS